MFLHAFLKLQFFLIPFLMKMCKLDIAFIGNLMIELYIH